MKLRLLAACIGATAILLLLACTSDDTATDGGDEPTATEEPTPTVSPETTPEPTALTNTPQDTPTYVISTVEGRLESASGFSTECLTLPQSFTVRGEWLVLCAVGQALIPAYLNPERFNDPVREPRCSSLLPRGN